VTSLVLALLLVASPRVIRAPAPIAIIHVTAIDAADTLARPDMTVILSGRRIRAMGPAAQVLVPESRFSAFRTARTGRPGADRPAVRKRAARSAA
jgi:hypothetical protein